MSLGLVEKTASPFLSLLGPIAGDGRLTCGTGGLTAIITVVLWRASWYGMKSATSVVVLILEVLEVVDIERG